jgi:hypothetical protein
MLHLNLVGYDPKTERVVADMRISGAQAAQVLLIAGVDLDDYTGPIGEIQLDAEQVAAISRLIAVPIKPRRLDYFLETTTAAPAVA